ncbi:MAG TPA: ABC transporter ATP-binding protein [Anaerolineaceae bacterium]|nr:ABC transporter ATP-binding protein [Anaerolineaceae bacterium]HPN52889.1 ABC transporter ATP-binding protein [Anaerolineaceae bacterium]
MGFFDGLDTEKYDRKYQDRVLVRRILSYFAPEKGRLAGVTALVLTVAGLAALQPIIVARGVDQLRDNSSSTVMILIGLSVLVTGVLVWLANWGSRVLMVRALGNVLVKLAGDAFKAAAEHDLSFYDEFSSGKIASRITSDTQDLGQLVQLVVDLISQIVEAGILLVVLFQIDALLTLYLLALVPIIFVLAISYRSLARKATRQGMRAMANVNATIKETVSGIAVAKNFRQEQSIYRDFSEANLTSYRINVRRGLVLTIVFPTLNALGGMASAFMIYTGGISAYQGMVTAGAWYLFLLSLDRFLFPVMNLSSFWTQVQNGLSAGERVFALIDAEAAVVQSDQQPAPELHGEIQFEHVSFRYKNNEPVLDDFNLHIQPGETIALVGHTGAGKSSVARLLARFYEFQSGSIRIDGIDIRHFELGSFRRQLGIVSQTPFLFNETVADNIRYARPGVTDAEIAELARQIGDGEWVDTLPNGLNTMVGERGARLSMGQRQLVSLMRVLVQKPAIFILDEATASIDPFTEWQIQQALNLIMHQSTSILIAHRLSTVRSADRILVIEKGRIIEQGNHLGLMNQGGHYASLYNTYFRHQSLAYIEQVHELMEEPV